MEVEYKLQVHTFTIPKPLATMKLKMMINGAPPTESFPTPESLQPLRSKTTVLADTFRSAVGARSASKHVASVNHTETLREEDCARVCL